MQLTQTHLKIIRALQQNAATPLDALAKQAAVSPSTLWRRIHELEAEGVVSKRVALIDPAKTGLTVCAFVNINLKSHSAQHRDDFEKLITDTPEIVQCYSVTGPHDYFMIIRVQDIASYEELLMNRILSHPSVAAASSNITLRELKYTTELPL